MYNSSNGSLGGRGDRVRTLRHIAVLGGEAHHVVLADQVVDPIGNLQAQRDPV